MRNKKLLSTVVASALVATTMAMPVMAADGNKVEVDFTTKNPVIRVVAPTTILAAVDPLEMNNSGTQIHSTDFTLENKSEVAVGIDVESIVTLGNGVTLVDTKKAAEDSTDTTKSEAWLAVAAETSDGKYIEGSKTVGDLTDADKNVTTFKTESSKSSASQTFYLNKGTGNTTYKMILPGTTGAKTAAQYKEELNYAQVYELTEATYNDEDALLAAVKTEDIYTGGSTESDGGTLTLIPAGTTSLDSSNAFDKTNKKYYTVSDDNALTATDAANQITDNKKYVYGEGGIGENTAFRYIGKLGSGKTSWTETDINHMAITYSIYGLTDDQYTSADKLDQLYTPITGPQVTIDTNGLITMTTVSTSDVKSLAVNDGTDDYEMNSTRGTWEVWDEDGTTQKFQLGDAWVSYLKGKSATAVLTLQDGSEVKSAVVAFPE